MEREGESKSLRQWAHNIIWNENKYVCVYSQRVHFNWFGCVCCCRCRCCQGCLLLCAQYSFCFWLEPFVFNIEWFFLPKWLMSLLLCVFNDGLLALLFIKVNNNLLVFFSFNSVFYCKRFKVLCYEVAVLIFSLSLSLSRFFSLNVGRRAPMMTLKANKIPKTHTNKTYWQDQTPFFFLSLQTAIRMET